MPHDFSSHPGPACHGISTDLADYFLTRRQLLARVGMGVGALGLASLVPHQLIGAPAATPDLKIGPSPLLPKLPHFPGKAKAIIHIFAQGAPSHVQTWDPHPTLTRHNNTTIPSRGAPMASTFHFNVFGPSAPR